MKRKRTTKESRALVRGIAMAAALVQRGPPPVTAARLMQSCSLSLYDLRAAGVAAVDFNVIAESMGLPDRLEE